MTRYIEGTYHGDDTVFGDYTFFGEAEAFRAAWLEIERDHFVEVEPNGMDWEPQERRDAAARYIREIREKARGGINHVRIHMRDLDQLQAPRQGLTDVSVVKL